MKSRGLMALAALIFAVAVLLAVFGVPEGEPAGGPDADAAAKLRFWHIQVSGPTKDAVEAAVARFQDAHPGTAVEAVGFKNDPYKTKLRIAMTSGAPPDVFHTWGGGLLAEYASAGKVAALGDPASAGAGFHRRVLAFCTAQPSDGGSEQLYALPADVTAVVFWYNKALFAEHGIDPPATWEAFETACRRFKTAGVTPLALGNAQSWPGCFYFIYLATRFGGTAPFAQGDYDHPCFVSAGERIQALVDGGFFSPGFNGMKYDGARREFFQGRAAMTLMGSWIISHCRNEAPDFLPQMDCFAFPVLATGPEDGQSVVVGGMNAGYAVSASSEHPDLARALARALTGPEAATDWAAAGRIPARGGDDIAAGARVVRSLARILKGASGIQLYYDQALPSALAALHKETTQALFAGELRPAEAAEKMAARARELRNEE